MNAVLPTVSADFLAHRKRIGADRHDEMWDGVLHMAPVPNREHQDLGGCLEAFLRRHLNPRGIKVYHEINVASPGRWPNDYRVPDLVIVGPDRAEIDRNEYFEGGPHVVVEIRSPGDESEAKLPFYARIKVTEVWIIDRDMKSPAVLVLGAGAYHANSAGPDGWVTSDFAGVDLRASGTGKLVVRIRGDDATAEEMPG